MTTFSFNPVMPQAIITAIYCENVDV